MIGKPAPRVDGEKARPYLTGAAAGLLARGISLAAGFGNLWFLTQILSKEQFAGYAFVLALLVWLAMVGTAGLDRTLLFRLSRIDAAPGALEGGPLVAAALLVVLPVSVSLALLVALGASAGGSAPLPALGFWLAVLAPVVVTTCLGRILEAWFWARGRVAVSLLVPAAGDLARTAGLMLAFFLLPTMAGVAIAVLAAALVPLLVWLAVAPIGTLRHPAAFDRGDVAYGVKAMLGKATNEGTRQLGVIMIGLLATAAATADYAVAARLAALVGVVKGLLAPVLTPRLSRFNALGSRDALVREFGQTRLLGFTAALLCASLLAAFGRPALGLFGDYEQGYPVLMVLSAGFIVSAGFGSNAAFLSMAGHAGWTLAARLVLLAAIVLLNIVLIPAMGAMGAALSQAIGMTAVNVLLCAMIWRLERVPTTSPGLVVLVSVAVTLLLLGGFQVIPGVVSASGLGVLALITTAAEWSLWLPAARDLFRGARASSAE